MDRRFLFCVWIVLSLSQAEDNSCISECSTSSFPRCGTWLTEDDLKSRAGIYELNEGLVNVSCVFSSLPRPSTVQWYHRPSHSTQWTSLHCNTKDEHRHCNTSGEQKVSSRCLIRTTKLSLSGSIRCQAFTINEDNTKSEAKSSEMNLEVVGMEKMEVIEADAGSRDVGHVEIEICANPRPEVWWITPEGLLSPGEALGSFASSHLALKLHREEEGGPGKNIPYCYQLRLLIKSVKMERVQVAVKAQHRTSIHTVVNSHSMLNAPLILVSFILALKNQR